MAIKFIEVVKNRREIAIDATLESRARCRHKLREGRHCCLVIRVVIITGIERGMMREDRWKIWYLEI